MILTELAERGVHAEVTVADGPTGTFLLADGEVRVDRGVSHDRSCPTGSRRTQYSFPATSRPRARRSPPRARSGLRSTRHTWCELPPGANVVFASGEHDVHALAGGRRLAVVTHGADGAIAVAGDRVERARPASIAADAPGAGDVFAATLLVELARGHELADALERATQAALDSLG